MKRTKIFLFVFVELIKKISEGFSESIGKVAVILQIAFPIVLSGFDMSTTRKILLSCVWVFLVTYMQMVNSRVNHKHTNGFPLPPCQLTTTDKEGFVEIVEGRTEAAIIYLSDVEEYLKKREKYYNGIDGKGSI